MKLDNVPSLGSSIFVKPSHEDGVFFGTRDGNPVYGYFARIIGINKQGMAILRTPNAQMDKVVHPDTAHPGKYALDGLRVVLFVSDSSPSGIDPASFLEFDSIDACVQSTADHSTPE